MPGLVPGIHVFTTEQQEDVDGVVCARQTTMPCHDEQECSDLCFPDKMTSRTATLIGLTAILMWSLLTVLTVATGKNPGVSTGGDDVRDRRAGGIPDLDRAAGCRQRIVATAPLHGSSGSVACFGYHALYFLALRFAPPAEAGLLNYLWPLFDRAVFVAAAGRTAGAAPYHRRRAWD